MSYMNGDLLLGFGSGWTDDRTNYINNLSWITNSQLTLNAIWRSEPIVRRVIEQKVNDMLRNGITIQGSVPEDRKRMVLAQFEKFNIWNSVSEAMQWAYLFGGSALVLRFDNDFNTLEELKLENIDKDSFIGCDVFDRWYIIPLITTLETRGHQKGFPKVYNIVDVNYYNYSTYNDNIKVLKDSVNDQYYKNYSPYYVMNKDEKEFYNNRAAYAKDSKDRILIELERLNKDKYERDEKLLRNKAMDSDTKQRFSYDNSRLLLFTGLDLPRYERYKTLYWGESLVENIYTHLVAFNKFSALTCKLLERASVMTLKLSGYKEQNSGTYLNPEQITAQNAYINNVGNTHISGLSIIDGTDELDYHEFSFQGLDNATNIFYQNIAMAADIPLIKLFGLSQTGFSDGQAQFDDYIENIRSLQESKLRYPLQQLVKILYVNYYGELPPEDLTIEFNSIRELKPDLESQIQSRSFANLVTAYEAGAMRVEEVRNSLKSLSKEKGFEVFSTIEGELDEGNLEPPPIGKTEGEEQEDLQRDLISKTIKTDD